MVSVKVHEEFAGLLGFVKAHPVLAFVILFIGRLVYKRYASPLRDVPGPFIASFTRLWKLRQIYRGDMEKTNIALHRKYGILVY